VFLSVVRIDCSLVDRYVLATVEGSSVGVSWYGERPGTPDMLGELAQGVMKLGGVLTWQQPVPPLVTIGGSVIFLQPQRPHGAGFTLHAYIWYPHHCHTVAIARYSELYSNYNQEPRRGNLGQVLQNVAHMLCKIACGVPECFVNRLLKTGKRMRIQRERPKDPKLLLVLPSFPRSLDTMPNRSPQSK